MKKKLQYYVYSVPVERANEHYYGSLWRMAKAYYHRRPGTQDKLLLVGGAGCTVGALAIDEGYSFDVIEPDDNEHSKGLSLYAGKANVRFRSLEDVLITNLIEQYGVVVWDAWVGTRCISPPVDFLERCFYSGVSVVAYVGDTASLAEVKLLVDGRK